MGIIRKIILLLLLIGAVCIATASCSDIAQDIQEFRDGVREGAGLTTSQQ